MGEFTGISWCRHTFNPWWGCVKVSEACRYCYAERDSNRFAPGLWGADAERRVSSEKIWGDPLRWDRAAKRVGERRRVFCASMADVFEARDDLNPARARLWALIAATPNHVWLLLTKRPQEILSRIPSAWVEALPPNVWVGTSVENETAARERIPHLFAVPAKVLFLSCEPLLGPVDLRQYLDVGAGCPLDCAACDHKIDWVIVGGESGPSARPMHPDWARSLRDQCAANRVAFHFKQWGEWAPRTRDDGKPFDSLDTAKHALIDIAGLPNACLEAAGKGAAPMSRVGKKAAGRVLDGVVHDAFPETATAP